MSHNVHEVPAMSPGRRIVLSRFPWFIRLFGLPFLLIGIYGVIAMICGIGSMTVSMNDGPSRPATPADAWLPGIFALAGLGIVLIRYSVVIDVASRMRLKTVGWGFWVKRTTTSLAGITHIDLGNAEERGSGSGRYTAIPVRAVGPDGSEELAEPRTFFAARKLAQQIAAALALPVGPRLAGTDAPSSAEVVDMPFAATAHLDPDDLLPPPGTKVMVVEAMRGIEIRYPGVRAGSVMVVLVGLVPLLFCGGFWWFIWRPGLVEPASKSTFLWFFMMAPVFMGLIPTLGIIVKSYRSGLFGGKILVDSQNGLRCPERSIAASAIRAIEMMPGTRLGGGLKVILDASEFTLCPGQNAADLRWIRALILRHLDGTMRR
jgi:hypothetical protein